MWSVGHIGGQAPPRRLPADEEVDESDEFVPDVQADADEFATLHLPEEMVFNGTERLPLWTPKWDTPALAKQRDVMGPRPFQRAFGQRPVTDDELVFEPVAIDAACDKTLALGQLPPGSTKWPVLAGCDIAAGGSSRRTAWWVLIVLAVDPATQHRYVLALEHLRGGGAAALDNQSALFQATYRRCPWRAANIEGNQTQSLVISQYTNHGKVPAQLVFTTEKKHTDLAVLSAEFSRGWWHLPAGDASSRRILAPLISELKNYVAGGTSADGGPTDCLMALYLGWQLAIAPPQK